MSTVPRGVAVEGFPAAAPARTVRKAAESALSLLACPAARIEIAAVDRLSASRLNRRYRGKTKAAEVLSFPMPEVEAGPAGQVVICLEEVGRQARRLGLARDRWLAELTVHGVLHVLGFHHSDPAAESQMSALQRASLREAGGGRRSR